MRNLNESIEGLCQHYLELLKNINRVLDINLEMFERSCFDKTLYGECVVLEDIINSFEVKIKEDSIFTIARFQPAARDLRLLIMLINSSRLLERMGDILKANLKYIKCLEEKNPQMLYHLHETLYPMTLKIKSIFEGYINSFVKSDEKILFSLLPLDEEIDEITESNTAKISDSMKKDSNNIDGGINLVVLNKKLERFSDHVIHLVFDLIYVLKGENMRKLELLEEERLKKENN